MIAAVVPTVPGREASLQRCLDSLPEETIAHVMHGYRSCGAAWHDGMKAAIRDGTPYVLLFADDLEARPGWEVRAIEMLDDGVLPAARLLDRKSVV